jgi:DNA topoisomerase-1
MRRGGIHLLRQIHGREIPDELAGLLHVLEGVLGRCRGKADDRRVAGKGVEEGINNPLEIDYKLVSSQQARRALDRIVGYKVSPFLWKVIFYGLSAGRVQSVALRLICEREQEIRQFIPQEYWSVLANFKDRDKNKIFESKLIQKNDISFKFNGESPKIGSETEADEILTDLKSKHFKISDINKKEVKRNPYPPFTTSAVRIMASSISALQTGP